MPRRDPGEISDQEIVQPGSNGSTVMAQRTANGVKINNLSFGNPNFAQLNLNLEKHMEESGGLSFANAGRGRNGKQSKTTKNQKAPEAPYHASQPAGSKGPRYSRAYQGSGSNSMNAPSGSKNKNPVSTLV